MTPEQLNLGLLARWIVERDKLVGHAELCTRLTRTHLSLTQLAVATLSTCLDTLPGTDTAQITVQKKTDPYPRPGEQVSLVGP